MTRNELKEVIKQVIAESRIRSSPMGYNAAIRAAAEKFKQQQADKDAKSKADDEKLAQMKPASTLSKAVNIIARIKQLSYKIEELEFYVPKKDDESEDEYYERVIPILKQKTQLEIDRLNLVLDFENLKK
jgi:hypothetical protein